MNSCLNESTDGADLIFPKGFEPVKMPLLQSPKLS